MENVEDFCVSHNYTQRDLLLLLHLHRCPPPLPPTPPLSPSSSSAAVIIALRFHPKHVTSKNKTKHIMKISLINITYDKSASSQQNRDQDVE
jgi:hypothetical protein